MNATYMDLNPLRNPLLIFSHCLCAYCSVFSEISFTLHCHTHQWLFSSKALLQKLPGNITTGLTFRNMYNCSGLLDWSTLVTLLTITKCNRKK